MATKMRDRDIVDACDRLIAIYPGRTPTRGTAHAIALAKKAGKPVEVR